MCKGIVGDDIFWYLLCSHQGYSGTRLAQNDKHEYTKNIVLEYWFSSTRTLSTRPSPGSHHGNSVVYQAILSEAECGNPVCIKQNMNQLVSLYTFICNEKSQLYNNTSGAESLTPESGRATTSVGTHGGVGYTCMDFLKFCNIISNDQAPQANQTMRT